MSAHLIRERADRDKSWRTVPVQNWGQASLSAVPSPCGNQAERYGERTASGTECGMKGDADQDAAEAVVAGTRAVKRVSRFMPNEARVERGLLVVSRKAMRGPTVELCKTGISIYSQMKAPPQTGMRLSPGPHCKQEAMIGEGEENDQPAKATRDLIKYMSCTVLRNGPRTRSTMTPGSTQWCHVGIVTIKTKSNSDKRAVMPSVLGHRQVVICIAMLHRVTIASVLLVTSTYTVC